MPSSNAHAVDTATDSGDRSPVTGYQTKDGEHKRAVRFYLSDDEWRAFLRAKAEAGHTDHSAFVVEALGLGAAQPA